MNITVPSYTRKNTRLQPGRVGPLHCRLQEIRGERNCTARQLSNQTGIKFYFISEIQSGSRVPTHEQLRLITAALACTSADLYPNPAIREAVIEPLAAA